MSTFLLFELLIIRNKTSSPKDFEFRKFDCMEFQNKRVISNFLKYNFWRKINDNMLIIHDKNVISASICESIQASFFLALSSFNIYELAVDWLVKENQNQHGKQCTPESDCLRMRFFQKTITKCFMY